MDTLPDGMGSSPENVEVHSTAARTASVAFGFAFARC
jgi:hypothetical protein